MKNFYLQVVNGTLDNDEIVVLEELTRPPIVNTGLGLNIDPLGRKAGRFYPWSCSFLCFNTKNSVEKIVRY